MTDSLAPSSGPRPLARSFSPLSSEVGWPTSTREARRLHSGWLHGSPRQERFFWGKWCKMAPSHPRVTGGPGLQVSRAGRRRRGQREASTSRTTDAAATGKGFGALRVPDFRLYLTGAAFSRIGDNIESVTRSWLGWELTGSPVWRWSMVFCHWIPNPTLSLFAGVLADRVDNRKLILFSESLYLISALG